MKAPHPDHIRAMGGQRSPAAFGWFCKALPVPVSRLTPASARRAVMLW